jgi:LysM repeat protein
LKLHIVRPGDTLRKIARRFDIPVQRLMDLNPSLDPEHPEPGAKVKIPGGKVPVARQGKRKAAVTGEKPKSSHRKPDSPPVPGLSEASMEGSESPEEQPLPKKPDQSPFRMIPPMPKAPEYRPGMAEEKVPESKEMSPDYTFQPLPYPFPSMSVPYSGEQFPQPTKPYPYPYPILRQPGPDDRQRWPVWPCPGIGQPQSPGFPYPGYGQPGQEQLPGFFTPGYGEQPEQGQPQQPWIPMPYPLPGFPQSQGFTPNLGSTMGESAREENVDFDGQSVNEPKASEWDISTLLHQEEEAWEESSTEK